MLFRFEVECCTHFKAKNKFHIINQIQKKTTKPTHYFKQKKNNEKSSNTFLSHIHVILIIPILNISFSLNTCESVSDLFKLLSFHNTLFNISLDDVECYTCPVSK